MIPATNSAKIISSDLLMNTKIQSEAVTLLKSLQDQLNDPVNFLYLSENPEYLARINAMVSELRTKLKK